MTFKQAWNRRSFLSMLSAAGVGLLGAGKLRAAAAPKESGYAAWPDGNPNPKLKLTGFGSSGDVWAELGVKKYINAWGTITLIGGSLIPPEVEAVMQMGSSHFGMLNDLERAAGKKIATMLKLPPDYSALVTAGACAALLCGYGGLLAGDNRQWITQIPDTTGIPKTEVIVQKSHRYGYDQQIRQTGIKMIEVETRVQYLSAFGPRTLSTHFLNLKNEIGQIKIDEWLKISHAHNVPATNDAAADTPPISRLSEYCAMGYDLVMFSGGKDMRGPQCAGLLLGRQPYIDHAQLNMSPQDSIARGSKVGKEEIFGMIKALELFLESDQPGLLKSYSARLGVIADAVKTMPGVQTSIEFTDEQIANHTPNLIVSWDPAHIKWTPREVSQQLADTEPMGIHAGGAPRRRGGPPAIGFLCWQMKPGEEHIVARRLAEIFHAGQAQA